MRLTKERKTVTFSNRFSLSRKIEIPNLLKE